MDDLDKLARLSNGMEALKELLSKRETTEEGLAAFLKAATKADDDNE